RRSASRQNYSHDPGIRILQKRRSTSFSKFPRVKRSSLSSTESFLTRSDTVKILKVLIWITAILLIQTMLISRVPFLRQIDLFLLFNFYFGLDFGQMACISISVPSGLVQDAFTHGIIGMNAFSKTIVVFLISGLSSRLMLKHPFVVMILIFIAVHIDLFMILG